MFAFRSTSNSRPATATTRQSRRSGKWLSVHLPRQVYRRLRCRSKRLLANRRTSILLNYMNGQDYPLERLPQPVVDALEKTEIGSSKKNIVVKGIQNSRV